MLWPRINKRENGSSNQEPDSNHAAVIQGDEGPVTDVDTLFRFSCKGLWGLLIFLTASAIALYFRDHTLTGTLSPDIVEMLGPKPPVFLINMVLCVSTFCSLIIISGRIYFRSKPGNTWTHLCFRLAFFILYFMADSLDSYFNMVFISSLSVLALQHYNFWNYYMRKIEKRVNIRHVTSAVMAGK